MLNSAESRQFLSWLKLRLVNKYKEEDKDVLSKIDEIIYYHTIVPNMVDQGTINKICQEYFGAFHKDDNFLLRDIFGGEFYSDQQEQIRSFVISMVSNILKSGQSVKTENNQQEKNDHNVDEYSFL